MHGNVGHALLMPNTPQSVSHRPARRTHSDQLSNCMGPFWCVLRIQINYRIAWVHSGDRLSLNCMGPFWCVLRQRQGKPVKGSLAPRDRQQWHGRSQSSAPRCPTRSSQPATHGTKHGMVDAISHQLAVTVHGIRYGRRCLSSTRSTWTCSRPVWMHSAWHCTRTIGSGSCQSCNEHRPRYLHAHAPTHIHPRAHEHGTGTTHHARCDHVPSAIEIDDGPSPTRVAHFIIPTMWPRLGRHQVELACTGAARELKGQAHGPPRSHYPGVHCSCLCLCLYSRKEDGIGHGTRTYDNTQWTVQGTGTAHCAMVQAGATLTACVAPPLRHAGTAPRAGRADAIEVAVVVRLARRPGNMRNWQCHRRRGIMRSCQCHRCQSQGQCLCSWHHHLDLLPAPTFTFTYSSFAEARTNALTLAVLN